MLYFAIFLGLYALSVFFLGLAGLLQPLLIILVTAIFVAIFLLRFRPTRPSLNYSLLEVLALLGILASAAVNFLGALGPEIFYDSLWYHLTLPKLYLSWQKIVFVPGNLFYYSAMPKLVEMLYFISLPGAAVISFLFGLLTTIVIIQCGKEFIGKKSAIIAGLVFYSNLGIAWLSTTASIDLGRTFFEAIAFFQFLFWHKSRNKKYLVWAGILTGFALGTKYHVLGTALILSFLIVLFSNKDRFRNLALFALPAAMFALPWYLFSFVATGNPLYPLFTKHLDEIQKLAKPGPLNFFLDFFKQSNMVLDWVSPISPIFVITLPLALVALKKFPSVRIIGLYCLLGYFLWFLTPRTGGSRFLIPYLPAFSLLVASAFQLTEKKFKPFLAVSLIVLGGLVFFNISVRLYINSKVLPVLLGSETQHAYLSKNLDFRNTFYDIDGYFEITVKKSDKVLFIGGHNLYYVNFPTVHESYYKNEPYNYVLIQYQKVPKKFRNWKKIYQNPITQVTLLAPPIN